MIAPAVDRVGAVTCTCPVCRHTGPEADRCPRCDWTLTAGPWAGHATGEHQRAFDDRLAAAQRAVDLRAVVRAAGFPGPGDPDAQYRLAGAVRGGPAGVAELDRVRAQLVAAAAPPDAGWGSAVGAALRRLVEGGPHTRLAVVDLTADGLGTAVLDGGDGTPRPIAPVRHRPWADVVAGLPADPVLARFVLAEGVGTDAAGPAVDLAAAAAAVAGTVDGAGTVLLVDRVSGRLPLVDHLVTAFREELRSRGRGIDVVRPGPAEAGADLLDLLAAFTPQRHALGLVVVRLDGDVPRPAVHPLFPRGSCRATARPVEVAVTGPAAGGQATVLAVVAGDPGAPLQRCRPVALARATVRPGVGLRVAIRLDGPDAVSVLEPAGHAPGRPDELPALLGAIPATYRPPQLDVDLAFLVELGGTGETVRRRVNVVQATIRWILERHPDPAATRFAVVGYGDHTGDPTDDVTRVRSFAAGDDVLAFLAGLAEERVRDAYYAPVEDALSVASGRRLGWRDGQTRRGVVTVGSRPPHPPTESVSRCPRRLAWRNSKDVFSEHQVRLVTVWDPPPWCDRDVRVAREARQTWAALGRPAGGTDAATVVAATGGIPGADVRRPLLFPIVSQVPGGN